MNGKMIRAAWSAVVAVALNRLRFTAAVFVILLGICLPLARAADDTHLLIISIDGLRGGWAAHPDKHGLKVPNLRKLAARGAHADGVVGIFPSVTYPSHTTLITGCRPARHGILANGVFEPPTEKWTERWYWDYKDIRVPTILDAARSAGWTTASVGWPVNVVRRSTCCFRKCGSRASRTRRLWRCRGFASRPICWRKC